MKSLRFGAFSEVNFGRGCKAIRSHKVGKDLIVEFDGAGNGIQPDEFAPKLLGRDKKGRLLYGYASLPYVNYRPAMLSAAYPMYDKEGKALTLEVKNYGLSSSAPSQIVVEAGGGSWPRDKSRLSLPTPRRPCVWIRISYRRRKSCQA